MGRLALRRRLAMKLGEFLMTAFIVACFLAAAVVVAGGHF
jgi:hypothetical protein